MTADEILEMVKQPMFTGVLVNIVENGAVVGKTPYGEDMIVTDSVVVYKGRNAWVTQKTYDALKANMGGV